MNLQKKIDKILKRHQLNQRRLECTVHKRQIQLGVVKTLVTLQNAREHGLRKVCVDLSLYGIPKDYLRTITDRLNDLPHITASLDSSTYEIHASFKTGDDL